MLNLINKDAKELLSVTDEGTRTKTTFALFPEEQAEASRSRLWPVTFVAGVAGAPSKYGKTLIVIIMGLYTTIGMILIREKRVASWENHLRLSC